MTNYCKKCNGCGNVHDPKRSKIVFWAKIECPGCFRSGYAMPMERPTGLPPIPPPHNPSGDKEKTKSAFNSVFVA